MNTQFNETLENLGGLTLDELLEEISVLDEWDNQTKLSGGIGEQWQNTHPKDSLLREDRRTDIRQKRVTMLK